MKISCFLMDWDGIIVSWLGLTPLPGRFVACVALGHLKHDEALCDIALCYEYGQGEMQVRPLVWLMRLKGGKKKAGGTRLGFS
jgi:hypothetical protein